MLKSASAGMKSGGQQGLRILKHLALAFLMYSRIPMPRLRLEDDDPAASLTFFPVIGAVIGGLICLLNLSPALREIPVAARIMVTVLIPILVTGGFHLDGFMDAEDALRSYAPREKRLEIMKDPHIGAFAVIGVIRILLLHASAVTVILMKESNTEEILILSGVFMTARSLSGLSALFFRKAKPEGMLYEETRIRHRPVVASLCVFLVLSAGFILSADIIRGALVLAAALCCVIVYRSWSYRLFGGVTGDTAGYFLVTTETVVSCVLALTALISP